MLSPTMDAPRRNAWLAAVLSLAPGLGHWYAGKPRKALALFFIDAGILLGVFFFRSAVMYLATATVYLVTAARAMHESWLLARYGEGAVMPDSKLYVVFMLMITGFNALPLLWQDRRFSRREKVAWSIAVPVLAALYFGGLLWIEFHLNRWHQSG